MAAAIAAALTIPVLIALYLLKLRRRPVRVGSIMFWPVAKQDVQANVPLRLARPSWLLLLHMLILLLMLGAVGRPALEAGAPSGGRIVLLIDASASMSAVDDGQLVSRLDLAKARALELIGELRRAGGRRELAVVSFAAEARMLTSFTSSRSVLTDSVRGIGPTDQPGSLGTALKLLDAMGTGGGEEQPEVEPATAVLISDGSFRDQGRLPPSTMRLRFERIGPPITLPESGATESSPPRTRTNNVGIVGMSARRDATDPGVVRVFVDVLNANVSPIAIPLTLSLNGEVLATRGVEVPGPGADGASGRKSTTFELNDTAGGVVVVDLGRGDALAADNSAAVVLPPATRPTIVLVSPVEKRPGLGTTAASWLLADALSEMRARSLESVTPEVYEARLANGETGGADLFVFDGSHPSRFPNRPSISFGPIPPVDGVTALPVPASGPTRVFFWQRSHPVLRNLSLDSLLVAAPEAVEVAEPEPGDAPVVELVRGQDGPLMLLKEDGPHRRLLVLFDLDQSNWPLQTGFSIFLADAIDYLTLQGELNVGREFSTDEAVLIRARDEPGRLVLRGPIEVVVREGTAGDAAATTGGVLSVGLLPRAGVYLVDGRAAIDRAAAVNLLDEVESQLASPGAVVVAGRAIETSAAAVAQREVWHWFMLAAATLLTIEWFMYARSVRS